MKKALILFLFFYILSLIQTSFLIHFQSFIGQIPNLILISAILFFFLEDPKKSFSFFVAFLGGFFIDLWSNQFLGTSIVLLIILAFILKRFLLILKKINIFGFILFLPISLFFYKLFLNLSFYFLNHRFLEIIPNLLDIFKFSLEGVIINLIFGIILFYFFNVIKNRQLI